MKVRLRGGWCDGVVMMTMMCCKWLYGAKLSLFVCRFLQNML